MNEVYTDREINGLLDYVNVTSREKEQLRQLMINALKIFSSDWVAETLTQPQKDAVVEMADFLQPVG